MATKKSIYSIAGLGVAAVTASAIAIPLALRNNNGKRRHLFRKGLIRI